MTAAPSIHPSSRALIDPTALIGAGTRIWVNVQVRERAQIGTDCTIGKDVFIDAGVVIGDRCKIQNGVSVYSGVTLEDGVFLGPSVVTTNDLFPSAITPAGALKSAEDWTIGETLLRVGSRVGGGAVIVCGDPVRVIGRWSLVAAGSVVTSDVPDFGLVAGSPARLIRRVCPFDPRHVVQPEGQRINCRECGRDLAAWMESLLNG